MNPITVKSCLRGVRISLLGCCAVGAVMAGSHAQAQAQSGPAPGVEDIIVTAQKREQNLQDVPIAITALSQTALQANRIVSVMDLGNMAPNLTIRPTAGGIGVANYSMRGSVSYGSVPGQDKAISTYLDGVYIGSSFGSAFELPDIERIEVLRGPQGTLFGRNSTAGAVSVVTRDPSGESSLRQVFTIGNYDQFRSSTRVDLPAWGPVSVSASFTHSERTGDIKNLGAGTVWNRTGPNTGQGIQVSPKTLGDENNDSVFVAVKFQPSDDFKTTYKFDWSDSHFTPEGNAIGVYTPDYLAAIGVPTAIVDAVKLSFAAYPLEIAGSHRPDSVNNAYTTPGYSRTQGHNLTSMLRLNDNISLKNILAFRKSRIFANSEYSGFGGVKITQAAYDQLVTIGYPAAAAPFYVGTPLLFGTSQVKNEFKQWSEELQLNYDSDLLTLTLGGIWYHSKSTTGAPDGLGSSTFLVPVLGGAQVIGGNLFVGEKNYSDNKATSIAGYGQAEIHVTPELDILGGIRVTRDKKSGIAYNFSNSQGVYPFTYRKTRPSFMGGVNYRPMDGILLYAKYSTGYVSGGSVSGIAFADETVKSWEGGVKADLFDRRLRANLALFTADYKNIQSVGSGATLTPPRRDLGTVVVSEGDLDTKGFELELNAVPLRGVTLTGALGYTDSKFSNINPLLRAPDSYAAQRPNWTANLSAQYETLPLFDETTMMLRLDATWRSKNRVISQTGLPAAYDDLLYSDAMWKLNGRVALKNISISGANAELAAWVRNLTNADNPTFPIFLYYGASATYERARTYGVDLTFEF